MALTTQGGVRTFDLALEPFRNAAGETAGLIGVAVDVTERRRTEEQLRQSGEQLRRLTAYLHFVHESQCAMTSREIQNDITQMLAALQLQLTTMADGLLDGADPSEAVERNERIRSNTAQLRMVSV